jgi:hypothetical protein
MPVDSQLNKDQTVRIYLIPLIGRFFKNLHCCSPPESPFSNCMSEFKNVLVMHWKLCNFIDYWILVTVCTKFNIQHHRVHTEWKWPLSGVHSIMVEKLAQPGEGGGVHARPLSLYLPQSKYRGRVEIAGVYIFCPLSWGVHFVRDGRYRERGRVCPLPSPA